MQPDVLKRELAFFFERYQEVISAYLFGSVAEDRTTPMSDIDVAVLIDEAQIQKGNYPYGYGAHLTGRLMSALRSNKIDLVVLNETTPLLQHRILSRGTRIFCRNPLLERQAFVDALHYYQNTAPLRRVQQLYLAQYLRNLGEPSKRG